MAETYYDILEVASDATAEEIEAAYRERVLETHPDHNDAPDAAEQFTRVSTAKSVLTDGTERARYDRLGHDAYLRLAHRTGGSSESNDDTSGSETARDTGDEATSGRQRRSRTSHTRAGSGRRHSRTSSDRNERAKSHHGRQRERRQRRTATQQSADGWPFDTDSAVGSQESNSSGSATSTSKNPQADGGSTAGFQYAVHDWDDEIDLEWEGQPLDQSTAVAIGCLWVLYPVFVAASLLPAFPTLVNAIVAVCTLGLIGYLLMKPRIATALFGFWGVVFPLGMTQTSVVSPASVTGIVALGFVWLPFGYAVALWWALRP